eukprot:COSAG02_NODE_2067_length_9945_cov_24.620150_4_plen_97_part_00
MVAAIGTDVYVLHTDQPPCEFGSFCRVDALGVIGKLGWRRLPLSEIAALTMLTLLVIVVFDGQTGFAHGPGSVVSESGSVMPTGPRESVASIIWSS